MSRIASNVLASLAAAAAIAVAGTAGAAFAKDDAITMSGTYQTPDGAITMEFGADGQMDGQSPTGVHVRDTFVIEDNVFIVTGADEHPVCPGAVGRYQLSEDDDGVITMTLISDECDLRAQGMNGGQWVKVDGSE
jgi:hypothetical protein